MRELLSCPFCGAVPIIGLWDEAVQKGHEYATAIQCSSDLFDCPVNPSVCDYSREEAIAAWNRRAPQQGEPGA